MTFRIPRGKHRARPWRFNFWWRKSSFAWAVKFTESCRYDLGNNDQGDTNKLVGIGYLPGHHKDSARFGWRYRANLKSVELLAYCYVNGRREIKGICLCEIGKGYRIRLQVLAGSYSFDAYEPNPVKESGMVTVQYYHKRKFKYRLGTYFGGNQKAPHEMKIEIKKV